MSERDPLGATRAPRAPRARAFLGLGLLALASLVAAELVPAAGGEPATPARPTPAEVAAEIDAILDARLEEAGVKAAPECDDATFLRRLSLDLRGNVPTVEEVDAFLADRDPHRREALVERFLADEAFAPFQAMGWYRTLTGVALHAAVRRNGEGARYLGGGNGTAFHAWLTDQIRSNRPVDDWVEEMITATGRTDQNPATVYLARWEGEPNNTIGAISKHFLGIQIQCAQCHDHIYETSWKQADFRGMAAFVAPLTVQRVPEYRRLVALRGRIAEARRTRGDGMEADEREELRRLLAYRTTVEVDDAPIDVDRLARRMRNRPLPEALRDRLDLLEVDPKLWMDRTLEDVPGISRRILLARWIVGDTHGAFGRTLANRTWGALLGRGFVDPVDDFSSFNTPSHPEALERLARDVRESNYDFRRLVRVIVSTRAYRRASTGEGEAPAPELFARAPVRPLSTDQIPAAFLRAAGRDAIAGRPGRGEGRALLAEAIGRQFSFVFDDDESAATEDFEGSVPQGLFLMNAPLIERGAGAERGSSLARLLATTRSDADRVTRLWRTVYGRDPRAAEATFALQSVRGAADATSAYEDLFWALLNSAEFLSNH